MTQQMAPISRRTRGWGPAFHDPRACGPLWKPRGSEEVARDSPHASQPFGRFYPSPGPCLPGPLIRAPVLKPRPPSRAGHFPGGVHAAPTGNGSLCGKHQNHACQTAPRRGQDPALRLYGNCEQNRKYQFPSGRRGGLQAARAILSCRERAVPHPRTRAL